MQYAKTEEEYIIRLEKGENFIKKIENLAEIEDIKTGFFNAIGAATSAQISFYDRDKKEYINNNLDEDHEIISLTGNVTTVEGKPFIHAHCVLSNKNFECTGGHLKEGIVGATCEIYLKKLDLRIGRQMDDEIGLKLLDCKQ